MEFCTCTLEIPFNIWSICKVNEGNLFDIIKVNKMFKGEGFVSKCLWCSQSIIVAFYKYLFNSNVNICILLCAYMMRLSRPHPRQKWSPQIRQLLVTHLPMFMALLYNLDDIHTIDVNKYEVSTYNTFCAVDL